MTAIPISTALGGPLSGAILRLDGVLGVAGWRWLLLIETLPSLLLGWATLHVLVDTPGSFRGGLVFVAGGALLTGAIALLIGDDRA